ncbi:MAG: hypothetical protein KAH54_03710 [Candidatus Sabulitectum sp.]|nr:hypothetical protein [Candidatus Sabulitectum sp.]
MKIKLVTAFLFLLLPACIGWSNEQKEVLEDYNALMDNAEEENWRGLARGFSEESNLLLDHIAEIYTEAGVPFDNSGEELLASLISDTDLLSFSEIVVSIEFRNEKAYLVSGQGSRTASYQFLRENQSWKLDLVPALNDFLGEIMEGTPTATANPSSSISTSPTYINTGQGACEFALRNDLEDISIWNVYCSPSDSDSWGDDWLGSSILGSGAEMGIWLDEGTYDIRLVDSDEHTYTLWQVELNNQGIFWPVTGLDIDETI